MKLGVCLPKLNQCTDAALYLAQQFEVVTPLDWLCPSVLVFDGVTRQYEIVNRFKRVRGHCLVAAKPEYMPTLWGGRCKGRGWATQKQQLTQSAQLAVIENHIIQTVRRFPQITDWDLIAGNVRADGKLRIEQWRRFLDRAIVANPRNQYWLDELLCTSFSRWKTILQLASDENIAGVGIQLHVNDDTNFDKTFELLEKVLNLAALSNIKVNLSEVGYWHPAQTKPNAEVVLGFAKKVKTLAEQYNVRTLTWWGLTPFTLSSHLQKPRAFALYDRELNPTPLLELLCK